MKIKVCGMTSIDQMHQLGDMGVEFAGMIFYPKSPRYVGKHGLNGQDVKKARLRVYKVGVFVNASYDEIMRTIDTFGLDMVQLHGHETPYECSRISNYVHTIKAFRLTGNDHVEWTIKDYYSDVDMFLFDTGVIVSKEGQEQSTHYGGTGRKFDWNQLRGQSIRKPFFLSGGIEPTDAGVIQEFLKDPVASNLFVVDINSRFELAPGIKNMELIKNFIHQLKG